MKKISVVFAIVFLFGPQILAQETEEKDAGYYIEKGMEAYQNSDFAGFRDNLIKARELRPGSPSVAYNLACAYSLAGDGTEAVKLLDKLVEMGIDFGIENDQDLKSLQEIEEFKAVLEKSKALKVPVLNSESAFVILEKDLTPEGIAYDEIMKKFYLGSMRKRKIISIDMDGKISEFISSGCDGMWAPTGLRVDPIRRLLWVCNVVSPLMQDYSPDMKNETALFKCDLEKGMLLGKYYPPDDRHDYFFNDIALKSNGDLYITCHHSGIVFKLDYEKDSFDIFLEPKSYVGGNGATISKDETKLFVVDYADGVNVVDLETGKYKTLKTPDNITLFGIDGMYFYDNSLLAVQNAIFPNRVVRYMLNDDFDAVTKAKIIEYANPVLSAPTTGAIASGYFYYIANSGFSNFDRDGNIISEDGFRDVIILKAKL
jgi:sugar lactone lactonase YvrE